MVKKYVQKGKYWCDKCNRVHASSKSKIYQQHTKFARKVSDYELRRLQFKRNWKAAAKEQAKYGAVNLPRKKKR